MARKIGASKQVGRPREYDGLALLAHTTPKTDQGYTLKAACEAGYVFLYPEFAADGNTIIYGRRYLSEETLLRQVRKARASLKFNVGALVKDMPADEAEKLAEQCFENAISTWGRKIRRPEGFAPSRPPKPGRPRKSTPPN